MGLDFTAVNRSPAVTAERIAEATCFVAEIGGQLVGTALMRPAEPDSECECFRSQGVAILGQLGVDSGHRGCGDVCGAASAPARCAHLRCGTAVHATGNDHASSLKMGGPMRATPSRTRTRSARGCATNLSGDRCSCAARDVATQQARACAGRGCARLGNRCKLDHRWWGVAFGRGRLGARSGARVSQQRHRRESEQREISCRNHGCSSGNLASQVHWARKNARALSSSIRSVQRAPWWTRVAHLGATRGNEVRWRSAPCSRPSSFRGRGVASIRGASAPRARPNAASVASRRVASPRA